MTSASSLQPLGASNHPLSVLPLRNSEEIQGDVLAGFCTDHRAFLFLRLADAESAKRWLSELVPRIATTKQVATFNARSRDACRQHGRTNLEGSKTIWTNVSLTSRGLVKLTPRLKTDLEAFPAFRDGPASRAA